MNWDFLKPIVAGQVRHFATVAAGCLIGVGALDKNDENSFVSIAVGVIMWAIVALWSWWQKVGQDKARAFFAKANTAAPVVKTLCLAFAIGMLAAALLSPGRALAQTPLKTPSQMFADIQAQIGKLQASLPPPKTPTQVVGDIQAQVAEFEKTSIDDFKAAQKIYEAANNLNGMACNAQLLKVAQANAAVNATAADGTAAAPSSPGLIAVVAKAYNLHVAFQTGSPARSQCAAMKEDVTNSTSPLLSAAGLTKILPFFGMIGL